MYETQTYEAIIKRCLGRVSHEIDRREGSIIFDALAPACAELATLYIELSTLLDRAFPDTATGEDLTKKVSEKGIARKMATPSVRRATFTGAIVPIGSRFTGGHVNYRVSAMDENGYQVVAEQVGSDGNNYFGTLLPIDYVGGLTGAELGAILIYGEDVEEDAVLRKRYFDAFDSQAFCGNIAAYKERIGEMDGVGGVKVRRTPEGGGTVGACIVDSNWGVPSLELIEVVQTAVDPVQNQGTGVGFAPIGHSVTISAVTGKTVDVGISLTLQNGVTWANIQSEVTTAIAVYLNELVQTWADTPSIIVRLSHIEMRVLSVMGIEDVSGTAINGVLKNLVLSADEIPTLGEVVNETV